MSVRLSMSMNDQGDVRLVSVTPGHDFPKVVKGEVPPVQHLRDGSHYVPDRLTAIRAELDALDLHASHLRLTSDLTANLRVLLGLPRETK